MLTLLIIHLVGLASPGPDFLYVVKQSASHSTRAGILAAIGISLGIIFWASFAIFGLAWLNASAGGSIQYLIMLVGGGYLANIGFKMIKSTQNSQFSENKLEQTSLHTLKEIHNGVMINIFNAKAGVYFTSVISAYIGNFTETIQLFELLFLFVFSTLIYFCLISLLFSRKPIRQFYSTYSRYIDNIAGIIFIGFGIKLIYDGIHYFI